MTVLIAVGLYLLVGFLAHYPIEYAAWKQQRAANLLRGTFSEYICAQHGWNYFTTVFIPAIFIWPVGLALILWDRYFAG